VRNSKVTGDSTGEYVRTCTPVLDDEIECNGAFQLSGGTIEIETTAHDDPREITATAAVVGGTGSYAGAPGTVDVNFEENTYALHLLIPNPHCATLDGQWRRWPTTDRNASRWIITTPPLSVVSVRFALRPKTKALRTGLRASLP
jgi:hypothetical protein